MVFQRCADVVKSWVEQAILDAESRKGRSFYFGFRNSPGALAIGDTELLTTTQCGEPASLIDQLGDLSINHIMALASQATLLRLMTWISRLAETKRRAEDYLGKTSA